MAALVCALACGAREPSSPEDLAERYFARLGQQDFAALDELYAPTFLARMEQNGTAWRTNLQALGKRRGALLDFRLQTLRLLPGSDGVVRIELTYRVSFEHERGIEQLLVRPPMAEGERFEIVEHSISTS